ncbi:MAG TPA: NAD(P)-dependent alcohol dehydrogenase [Acidimicrobiia bacterium]|nr:NAD(P)-dependent alcohol dehydrogenase [Acidimicrobiia bacterium]
MELSEESKTGSPITSPIGNGIDRHPMMRAIVQDRYGPPEDVLRLDLIDRPVPGDGEVLVRVRAAVVGGTDWHLLRGLPYAARLVTGLRKPKNTVPGLELAGTVEAVGKDVESLEEGAEVFGWCDGSFAEYAAVPEDQLLPKPASLTFARAAVVPIAAFTALQGVGLGRIQPRQKVLITGASGGVGFYAVQIAKLYGAEVTGVCSTPKMDLVRSLGADHVIDYTEEHFTQSGERYDVLIDLYGNPSLSDCRRALKPRGTLVLIGGTGGKWFMGVDRWMRRMLIAPFLRLKVRPLIHKDSRQDLATIRELIEGGKLAPVVDRAFPLASVAEAVQFVREGRAHGQVSITI